MKQLRSVEQKRLHRSWQRRTEQRVALLLVEQYVARALELADYVYVLAKGRIEFAGEPGELEDEAVLASYLGEVAT